MQAANGFKGSLQGSRKHRLGAWQMLPGTNLSRTLAACGYDWILVDCEHGNIDDAAMHECIPIIASYGVSPIVRVPDFQSWMIKRALDAGAHGILAPLVRSVEDARAVVSGSKFPPLGQRGFGSPFPMDRFNRSLTSTEYLQQANSALTVAVQIETKEALEVVDAIAAIDGIDILFVGPFDLGNNIGYPVLNGILDESLQVAIQKILDAAVAAGKEAGIFCSSAVQARAYAETGFHMINLTTDVGALTAHLSSELATFSGDIEPGVAKAGPYGSR